MTSLFIKQIKSAASQGHGDGVRYPPLPYCADNCTTFTEADCDALCDHYQIEEQTLACPRYMTKPGSTTGELDVEGSSGSGESGNKACNSCAKGAFQCVGPVKNQPGCVPPTEEEKKQNPALQKVPCKPKCMFAQQFTKHKPVEVTNDRCKQLWGDAITKQSEITASLTSKKASCVKQCKQNPQKTCRHNCAWQGCYLYYTSTLSVNHFMTDAFCPKGGKLVEEYEESCKAEGSCDKEKNPSYSDACCIPPLKANDTAFHRSLMTTGANDGNCVNPNFCGFQKYGTGKCPDPTNEDTCYPLSKKAFMKKQGQSKNTWTCSPPKGCCNPSGYPCCTQCKTGKCAVMWQHHATQYCHDIMKEVFVNREKGDSLECPVTKPYPFGGVQKGGIYCCSSEKEVIQLQVAADSHGSQGFINPSACTAGGGPCCLSPTGCMPNKGEDMVPMCDLSQDVEQQHPCPNTVRGGLQCVPNNAGSFQMHDESGKYCSTFSSHSACCMALKGVVDTSGCPASSST